MTLRAAALDAQRMSAQHASNVDRVAAILGDRAAAVETQSWEFLIGQAPSVQMLPFAMLAQGTQCAATNVAAGHVHTLSVPGTSSLPYTVYYANLHSQTNDSDGGGNVSTCVDAQAPQSNRVGADGDDGDRSGQPHQGALESAALQTQVRLSSVLERERRLSWRER